MPTQHTPLLALPYPSSGSDLVAEGDDILRELAARLEVVIGPPSGPAGGDLGGTYPNPQVVTINGVAVSAVVFTGDGRLTNSRPPTGVAAGDLGGTYPNPTVEQINGRAKTAVVFTDDGRLSDARTPTAHAASHRAGGSDPLAAIAAAAVQVRDVGEANQIRAGRVLTPTDFTNLGLTAPTGLWNLGTVNDASGNARNLTNKGTVPFGLGIMGAATEAALFAGSTAQALYIADAGAGDPFRVRAGSFGCWFRTAKRSTVQAVMGKYGAAGNIGWYIELSPTGAPASGIQVSASSDGVTAASAISTTDVCDDRWHHVVATADGAKLRLYLDGVLEATATMAGALFPTSGPLNIGGILANAATATTEPFFGRVDEAFVTPDVLSLEQVRNLYCGRVAHALAVTPTTVRLRVRRRRRGGPLAPADYTAAGVAVSPLRLHNFTAGSVADQGTAGVALTPNPGTGAITDVAGADGTQGAAKALSGAHTGLSATDAGLPAGTASRCYGIWIKGGSTGQCPISWGTVSTADARLFTDGTGLLVCASGADTIATGISVIDGQWHHVVVVEDNAPADGVKRKVYLDGRLVGGSTVLTSLTLAGANRFRVGANPDGTNPYTGQVDGAFVAAAAPTPEWVRAIYNFGSQALAPSPKDAGAHVEAIEAASLLAVFDTLKGSDQIDLGVAA